MGDTSKLPLAQRLLAAGQKEGGCQVFCGISTKEYFFELSRAKFSLQEIYLGEICAYSCDEHGMEMPISGTAAAIGRLPEQERNALLYRMLVEPFARMDALRRMECCGSSGCEDGLKDMLCELGAREEDFI